MSTKTQTTTTHYHIQKKRRAEFIEEWRKYRQTRDPQGGRDA